MTATANVSASAASTAASTTASTSTSSDAAGGLTQSDFLQLLTAQLKYQSPTSPADTTQMAEEFASISTVDGINNLNTELNNIATSSSTGEVALASSLVGREVAVSGNGLTVNSSGKADGAFNLASASANTNVTILNKDGSVAGTMDLGALQAGQQNFSWSGGTAGNSYSYSVNATDSTGNAVSVMPYSVYNVKAVDLTGSAPALDVEGTSSSLPVSSVATVLGASS